MELMPGYKRSDVGAIPDDWDVLPLGKLVRSVEYGSAAKSDVKGAVPVLRMGNLQGGKIDWSDLVYTDDIDEIKKYTLQPGDVLFNRTNTIDLVGKTSIYEGGCPAIFAGYLIRINVVPDLLDSRFLNYILNTEFSRKYSAKVLSVAVGQANINGQKLKTYPIPLPPTKTEQEDIAQALSDVDELLVALDQIIAKKRDLKQAAMQQLLTGKIRLPGFSGEWEERRLGKIAEMGSGGTPTTSVPAYYDGDIPWVSISDMTNGGKFISTTERNLTHAGFASCAAQMFPAGAVLYAMYASLGECSIAAVSLCSSQAILGIRPRSTLNNEFLYYYLTSLKQIVKSLGQQGTQANLNKGMVQDFQLDLPPISEQTAIATVLSDMDAELSELEVRRDKTRNIKQAMMQELLTGKTRLV